ncbi:hypothetical protein CBM2633_P170004 [Cupriavidus taiwanensis]|nr:hypothetical protein CBM2585_P170004 [Cupriavidus taiwanensis]SOZ21239.1 hypothetical protein CBM2604_P170004 [Cupriavidus taiwanensis]SOZ50421.1 hypothetical protein CBM2610_P150004 [Cupriavidus taiwanensis]SPA23209.1 hypothetical protein CBM2633_P170004 [Cupriavidus taiwanensis]
MQARQTSTNDLTIPANPVNRDANCLDARSLVLGLCTIDLTLPVEPWAA